MPLVHLVLRNAARGGGRAFGAASRTAALVSHVVYRDAMPLVEEIDGATATALNGMDSFAMDGYEPHRSAQLECLEERDDRRPTGQHDNVADGLGELEHVERAAGEPREVQED